MSTIPSSLPPCDPKTRLFPPEWKEAYFRRNYDENHGGYVCPDCKQVFYGPKGFRQLEADHIKPYSQCGLTVWENMTLRCKACNLAKSDKI